MTTTSTATRFDDVLAAEHLADLQTTFADADYCDEVPLYSRYEQISFLEETGDVNSALIELALDYLERLNSELPLGAGSWVAVSIIRDVDSEPIIPSAFVCKQRAKDRLGALRLVAPPASDFGRYIQGLVRNVRESSRSAYSVFEDTQTVPGEVRVFVSKEVPPIPVLMR